MLVVSSAQNRVWLNAEASGLLAALAWSVNFNDEAPHESVGASLTIRDCSRQVDLDFDACATKNDGEDWSFTLDERIGKIDTIIRELRAMRGALVLARKARKKVKP